MKNIRILMMVMFAIGTLLAGYELSDALDSLAEPRYQPHNTTLPQNLDTDRVKYEVLKIMEKDYYGHKMYKNHRTESR